MAEHVSQSEWKGRRRFEALAGGHTIVMDAPARVGGEDQGSIPKPLVLTALSGCTGMDVVALLEKGGHTIDRLANTVRGELSKGQPMRYTAAHITFHVDGPADSERAVIEAVNTSQQRLCGVSAMLQDLMPVTWEIRFNDRVVHTGQGGPPSLPHIAQAS